MHVASVPWDRSRESLWPVLCAAGFPPAPDLTLTHADSSHGTLQLASKQDFCLFPWPRPPQGSAVRVIGTESCSFSHCFFDTGETPASAVPCVCAAALCVVWPAIRDPGTIVARLPMNTVRSQTSPTMQGEFPRPRLAPAVMLTGSPRDPALPVRDLFPDRARHIRDRRGSSYEYSREQRTHSDSLQAFGIARDRRTSRHSPSAGDFADFRDDTGYSRRSSDTSLRRRSPSPPQYFSRGGSSSRTEYPEDYRSVAARPGPNRPPAPGLHRRSTEVGRFAPRRSYDPSSQAERDRLDREKEAKEYKDAVNRTQQSLQKTRPKSSNGVSQPAISTEIKDELIDTPSVQARSMSGDRAVPSHSKIASDDASNGVEPSSLTRPTSPASRPQSVVISSEPLAKATAPDIENTSDAVPLAAAEVPRESRAFQHLQSEQQTHAEPLKSVNADGYVNPFDMVDDSSNDESHHSSDSTSAHKDGDASPHRNTIETLVHADECQSSESPLSAAAVPSSTLPQESAAVDVASDRMMTSPAESEASTVHLDRSPHRTQQLSASLSASSDREDAIPAEAVSAAMDTISIASDMDNLRSSPEPSRRSSVYTVNGVPPVLRRQHTEEREHDNQLIAQLCGKEDIQSTDDGIVDDGLASKNSFQVPPASPSPCVPASPGQRSTSDDLQVKRPDQNMPAAHVSFMDDGSSSQNLETNQDNQENIVGLQRVPDHPVLLPEEGKSSSSKFISSSAHPEENHDMIDALPDDSQIPLVGHQRLSDPAELKNDFAKLSSEKPSLNAIEAAISGPFMLEGPRNQFLKSLAFVRPPSDVNNAIVAQIMQENQEENGNTQDVERRRPFAVPSVDLPLERKAAIVKLIGQKIKASYAEYERCRYDFMLYNKKWQQHTAKCDRARLIEIEQEEKDAVIAASASTSVRGTRNKPVGYEVNEAMVGIALPSNALNEASIPNVVWRPIERELFNYIDWNSKVYDVNAHYFENKPEREWTVEEHERFFMLYKLSPKEFGKIAENMPGLPPNRKTACECVRHYYLTKKNVDYRQLGKKVRASTRGRGRGRKVVVPRSTRRMQLISPLVEDGEDSSAEDESDNRALRRRRTAIESDELGRKKIRKVPKRPEVVANKTDVRPSQEQVITQPQSLLASSSRTVQDISNAPFDPTKQSIPADKRGNSRWYEHEEAIFLDLLQKFGANFSIMLPHLPGKTFEELQQHFNDNLIERGYRQYLPRTVLGPPILNRAHASQTIGTSGQPLQTTHSEVYRTAQNPQNTFQPYSSYHAPQDHRLYSSYQAPSTHITNYSGHQLPPFNSGPYHHGSNNYDTTPFRPQGPSRPVFDPRYDNPRNSSTERAHAPIRGSIDSMLNSGEKVQLPPITGDPRGDPSRFGGY